MEIDFLGLKKKSDSGLPERETETLCCDPGCSYSGLNLFNDQQRKYAHDSSYPAQFSPNSSVKSFLSLSKKNYNKPFNINFSERVVQGGVINKCSGLSTSQLPTDKRKDTKLTIFYANSVYVFDNISPEKAQAILSMAEHEHHASFEPRKMDVSKETLHHFTPPPPIANSKSFQLPPETRNIGTIPQARKASLFRFLEKRKHRLKGMIPFTLRTDPSSSSDCSYPLASASFVQKANH